MAQKQHSPSKRPKTRLIWKVPAVEGSEDTPLPVMLEALLNYLSENNWSINDVHILDANNAIVVSSKRVPALPED